MPTLLIVDDDTTVITSLELLLRRAGYTVQSVTRPAEVLPTIAEFRPALVLLDLNFTISTTGRDGMKLLREILAAYPRLPVIQMTGWATVQLAVEGMKAGARDFLAKPWDNRELLNTIATQLKGAANPYVAGGAAAGGGGGMNASGKDTPDPFASLIGKSTALAEVIDQARRVAPTQASVLITGESGTGKELLAEALHTASTRARAPFVAVNLGGIPPTLFDSELFGHRAGAFTDARTDRKGRFELAEGGTLFLDEIGDVDATAQVKLLRVLQERQYERLGESTPRRTDVRIISATSRDLHRLVHAGTFREDLLYRINLIHLHLPPLRERPADVPPLAEHFLAAARRRYERPDLRLERTATEWLQHQPLPGNVRQLQNLIERAAILTAGPEIGSDELASQLGQRSAPTPVTLRGRTLEEIEVATIEAALRRNEGAIAATARELGLTRAALYRRIEKYGLRTP